MDEVWLSPIQLKTRFTVMKAEIADLEDKIKALEDEYLPDAYVEDLDRLKKILSTNNICYKCGTVFRKIGCECKGEIMSEIFIGIDKGVEGGDTTCEVTYKLVDGVICVVAVKHTKVYK